MLRVAEAKFSARTQLAADRVIEDKSLQVMEQLTRQGDENSSVTEIISQRIDARLGKAMSRLRSGVYTRAPSAASSQSRKTHTPQL